MLDMKIFAYAGTFNKRLLDEFAISRQILKTKPEQLAHCVIILHEVTEKLRKEKIESFV